MNGTAEARKAIEEKLAHLEKEASWVYEGIEQTSRRLQGLEEKHDAVTKARDALSQYLDLVMQQGVSE